MSDLNMCTVSMRITKEVKVKEQENGAVISFCGAIHDDSKKDDGWITNTTFMDVLFYVKDLKKKLPSQEQFILTYDSFRSSSFRGGLTLLVAFEFSRRKFVKNYIQIDASKN